MTRKGKKTLTTEPAAEETVKPTSETTTETRTEIPTLKQIEPATSAPQAPSQPQHPQKNPKERLKRKIQKEKLCTQSNTSTESHKSSSETRPQQPPAQSP